MALSWLYRLFGRDLFKLPLPFVRELDERRSRVLLDALESGLNWPLTSSCGRLFDAVAALCRVRTSASYEGQAALELEGAAEEEERASAGRTSGAQLADQLPPAKSPPSMASDVIAVDPLVRAAVDEIARGCRAGEVAARFHRRLAEVLVSSAASIARSASLRRVALGGGCFQNRILLSKVADGLRARGLEVLLPGEVPVNDGGLALGQAAVAADYLRRIA